MHGLDHCYGMATNRGACVRSAMNTDVDYLYHDLSDSNPVINHLKPTTNFAVSIAPDTCKNCPAGRHSAPGHFGPCAEDSGDQKIRCPPLTGYTGSTGNTGSKKCELCPLGKHSYHKHVLDTISCNNCANPPNCIDCPNGKYGSLAAKHGSANQGKACRTCPNGW